MTEIIPGILAKNLKELTEQLRILSFAKKVHIDIMDGAFVPNKTIQALTLKKNLPDKEMQIHLMAQKPHKHIKRFSRLGAKELIFHAESTDHASETLEDIRLSGMKAGIAFNPQTPIERHKDSLVHADIALVMTVHPGFFGQTFIKKPLHKIEEIKKHNPVIQIGIDGGISLTTCKLVHAANFAIATSAIQKTDNPERAYEQLLNVNNHSLKRVPRII